MPLRRRCGRPGGEDVGVDPVPDRKGRRRVGVEPGRERGVERGDLGHGQRRADTAAGAHPAAPARARERHVGVEPEHRLDPGSACSPRRLAGDGPGPVAALPLRIGRQHQRLAGARDRIVTRQPAEVGRDEQAVRGQHAAQLGKRALDVEVHPALARDRDLEAGLGERSGLGRGDDEIDGEPFVFGAAPGGLDLAGGDVDAGHRRAAARELARDQAGAGAEVEQALPRPADAERRQDLEQALRRPGTMRGVVGRGAAPVDGAAAIDRLGARLAAHGRAPQRLMTSARAPTS